MQWEKKQNGLPCAEEEEEEAKVKAAGWPDCIDCPAHLLGWTPNLYSFLTKSVLLEGEYFSPK